MSLDPSAPAARLPPAAPPGLLRLAWPIFAEQSLHLLTGIVDTLMASRIGDDAVAGLGSAWQIIVIFLMGFNMLAIGASIATTHHLGLGDRDGARRLARGAVGTNLWLGAAFSVLLGTTASTTLHWAQLQPAPLAFALPFLRWMGGTLFLESMNFSLCAVLRANGHTREVMFVMLGQNIVNATGSATLIFGLFGLPALGVTGIALAAAASRLLACVALWRLANRRLGLALRPRDLVAVRVRDLRRLLSFGVPAVLENVSWFAAFMVVTAFTARMGGVALATQAYVQQIAQVEMLASLSIGLGNEIVVGRLVGAGRFEEARAACLAHMKIGLAVTMAVALAAALAAPAALGLFTHDARIVDTGRVLVAMGLLLEPGRALNLIVINALRASGDTRFPLVAGLVSQWFCMAFGGWFLGTFLKLGLVGTWCALILDEGLRGLAMLRRWRRRRWMRHARRVQAEAAHGNPAIDGPQERLQRRPFA